MWKTGIRPDPGVLVGFEEVHDRRRVLRRSPDGRQCEEAPAAFVAVPGILPERAARSFARQYKGAVTGSLVCRDTCLVFRFSSATPFAVTAALLRDTLYAGKVTPIRIARSPNATAALRRANRHIKSGRIRVGERAVHRIGIAVHALRVVDIVASAIGVGTHSAARHVRVLTELRMFVAGAVLVQTGEVIRVPVVAGNSIAIAEGQGQIRAGNSARDIRPHPLRSEPVLVLKLRGPV